MAMVDFNLVVVTDTSEERFSPALSADDFGEGISARLLAWEDGGASFFKDEGEVLLFLSDNADHVREAAAAGRQRRHIIFIGEEEAVSDCIDRIDDVWHSSASPALLKKRYLLELASLKNCFNAVFYEQVLDVTINTIPDLLWFKRDDGIYSMVNDVFCEVVHKDMDEVVGKDHFAVWDVPLPEESGGYACEESDRIAIDTGQTYVGEETVMTKTGMKQLVTYKTALYDALGNLFGTIGVAHDLTNLKSLGIELSIMVENMPFPMAIFSLEKRLVLLNTYFRRVVAGSGITYQKAAANEDFADSFDYTEWKRAVAAPQGKEQINDTNHSVTQEHQIRVNGRIKRFLLMELEIRDFFDNCSGYICVMQDITFQRTYERSILKAANTDVLTGLYNRRYFYDYLTQNLKKEFFLLYIDLDRFKVLNDTYGHNIGDRVLEILSGQLRRHFPNALTARLGGDEFAVIDEVHSEAEIDELVAAFEKAAKKSFSIYECGTGVSVGIVYNDGTHDSIDELIHMGDAKMYEVKKQHHNAGV